MTAEAVLIVGCGDIGRRVAALELADGNSVTALARSDGAARELTAHGLKVVRGDLDVPGSIEELPARGSLLYYFAPPPDGGVDDPRLARFLERLDASNLPKRVVYISTSGVYGDCQGDWVGEDRPVNPKTERAKRRVAAESCLREWSECRGVPIVILRVPGIYGPGRLPLERLRKHTPVVCEAEAPYSNRIHADDLARVCHAAARRGGPGEVYNVSDGHPGTMTQYFYAVADRFGIPRPPAVTMAQARAVLGAAALSFLEESKRLDNRRMLAELHIQLAYPDLISGLAACDSA